MLNYLFTKTPLLYFVQSFWRDEAFSYLVAKNNILEIVKMTLEDFSPPLYYFILHFWINIFGKSEIALRSLSLIFYWATIYIVFLFLTEVFRFNLKKSLLYLFFFIFNPLLIYYAFETRMYSLLAFLATLSFYSLYRKNSKVYLISTILALYTHYFMLVVLFFQFIFFRYKQKQAFFSFIPWILLMISKASLSNQSFWISNFKLGYLFTFIGNIFTGYESGSSYYANFYEDRLKITSLILWLIILFGYIKTKKNQSNIFRFLLVWGTIIPLFVALLSFVKPIFLPRYLIYSTVGLLLLIAYSLDKMPYFLKIFLIALIFYLTFGYQQSEIKYRTKSDMIKTIKEIKNLMKPSDFIYVTSELDYFTAKYYLENTKVYIYKKNYEDMPKYIGKVLINKEDFKDLLPIFPNKAFIISGNGQYDIQSM